MGTRSADSEIKLVFSSTVSNTLTDGQVASATIGATILSGTIANGVETSQASRAWEDQDRSLNAGVTEDIDLYDFASIDIGAGTGKDALGQAMDLEEIVTLIITQTGGTGRLEIMPSQPANYVTWVPSLTVANGGALRTNGILMLHNPHASAFDITDGASHMLRIGANGGTATYDIFVLGRHDDEASSSSSSSQSTSTSSSLSTKSSSSSLSTTTTTS